MHSKYLQKHMQHINLAFNQTCIQSNLHSIKLALSQMEIQRCNQSEPTIALREIHQIPVQWKASFVRCAIPTLGCFDQSPAKAQDNPCLAPCQTASKGRCIQHYPNILVNKKKPYAIAGATGVAPLTLHHEVRRFSTIKGFQLEHWAA